jgi:hypothetical protein
MRLRSLLIWLFAFLLVYGAYEYWYEREERPFEAQLFPATLAEADRIEIRGPDATEPLVLTRTDAGWVASQAKANLPADSARVGQLIRSLRGLRSYGVAAAGSRTRLPDWNAKQTWELRIREGSEQTRLRLRNRLPRDSQQHITAYLRIDDRPEWYAVGPIEVDRLPARIGQVYDLALSSFPLNFAPRRVHYLSPDTTLSWTWAAGQWVTQPDGNPAPELTAYVDNLARLRGPQPAMYFDETRPERFARQAVTVYGLRGDSIRINCWYDTLRPNRYFLQSSQNPRRWVAADSTWVRRNFSPLR